jgi:hypothetical protein
MNLNSLTNYLVLYQRQLRLVLMIFLFCFGVLIYLYFFKFNQGKLTITGPAPFVIEVENTEISCSQSPCSKVLQSGRYQIALRKEGFFAIEQEVEITRNSQSIIEADFKIIPTLNQIAEIDGSMSFLIQYPREFYSWNEVLPENSDLDFINEFIEINGGKPFAWHQNSKSFFYLDFDKVDNLQKIFQFSKNDPTPKALVATRRDLQSAMIAVSTNAQQIAVTETANTNQGFYLMNLNDSSSRFIEGFENAQEFQFLNDDYLLIESFVDNSKETHLVDSSTLTSVRLDIDSAISNMFLADDSKLVVVSPDLRLAPITNSVTSPKLSIYNIDSTFVKDLYSFQTGEIINKVYPNKEQNLILINSGNSIYGIEALVLEN